MCQAQGFIWTCSYMKIVFPALLWLMRNGQGKWYKMKANERQKCSKPPQLEDRIRMLGLPFRVNVGEFFQVSWWVG